MGSVNAGKDMTVRAIAELKGQYIDFYKVVPIQKWAAKFVGRDEDTIITWKRDDLDFSGRVQRAESEAIKNRLKTVRSDWFLERVFKEDFAQRHELTGPHGGPIQSISYSPQQLEQAVFTYIDKHPEIHSRIKDRLDV